MKYISVYTIMAPKQPYPSMIDLQSSISDVDQLLTSYKQAHQSYVTDVQSGLHKESKLQLTKLKTLNDRIDSRLEYIKQTSHKINDQENIYKNNTTQIDGNISSIFDAVRKNKKQLRQLQSQHNFHKGEIESANLAANSNYAHLVIFFIIYAVVAYFLMTAINTNESGQVEIIILILGISIFIYYFLENTF